MILNGILILVICFRLLGVKDQQQQKPIEPQVDTAEVEGEGETEKVYKKEQKSTFNHQLDRIKKKSEEEKLQKQQEFEERKRKLDKKLKEKSRKARVLNRKTKKGQPVMKNLLNYYINDKLSKQLAKAD